MRKLTAFGFGLAVATFGFSALAEDAPKAAPADAPAASASTADSGVPISIGLRAGYALALGSAQKDVSMSDTGIKGAIPFTLDAFYRVSRAFRVGAYFSYGILMLDKDKFLPAGLPQSIKDQLSVSGSWLKYGLQLQYHLSPEASTDPWIGYGIGLESLKASLSGGGASADETISGIEFAHLMAGADFKVSNSLGVGPFVDFSLGQYSSVSSSGASADIKDKAMHMWLYLGIRGNYDL